MAIFFTMPHILKPMPLFGWDDIMRFWMQVNTGNEKECWLWSGERNGQDPKHHAPQFSYGPKVRRETITSSRVAYFLHYKEDPGKLLVCHSCDNQLCMNPHHLWLGTQKENMQDCSMKGRTAIGNSAKLVPEEVVEIRRLYHDENIRSPKTLGERFSVTPQQIWDIVTYKKWRHL